MSKGVHVRLSGKLKEFIEDQSGDNGLYENASEYIRDLVRRDYEREQQKRWSTLIHTLQPGLSADTSAFVDFDPKQIIDEARSE